MMPLNWTTGLTIRSPATIGATVYEEGRCESPLLLLILKIQPAFLLTFGFVANLCSFIVLIRPRLRRRPTFSYLAFLSLSNSFLSLIHALFTILGVYFGLTLENLSLWIYCRLLNRFSIDFLTHFSLYTLTAVDLDRIKSVTSKTSEPHRHGRSGGGIRPTGCARPFIRVCIIETCLAVVIFLINVHWLTSYGYTMPDPFGSSSSDQITYCTISDMRNATEKYPPVYAEYLTTILPIVELILFGILPFSISVVATIIILRHVSTKYSLLNHVNKRLKQSRRRMELHLSILLISLNCVFILFTTPHNLYNVYIGNLHRILGVKRESEGELCSIAFIQKSLDLLQQCYFMSTFFLYILTNKRFREELCEIIKYKLFSTCQNQSTKPSMVSKIPSHRHRRHHRHRQNSSTNENHLMLPRLPTETRFSVNDEATQDDFDDDEPMSSSRVYDSNMSDTRLSINRLASS